MKEFLFLKQELGIRRQENNKRMTNKTIILASGSPRRSELLKQAGFHFKVEPSQIEEVSQEKEPGKMVEELSRIKALDIAARHQGEEVLVIGSDTLVFYEEYVLGKPSDEADAYEMINKIQGKEHFVYTGVTFVELSDGRQRVFSFHEKTKVQVAAMDKDEILTYIATKEPMDKAGAYAIQGLFAPYIKGISGAFSTVVGFPIERVVEELEKRGIVSE